MYELPENYADVLAILDSSNKRDESSIESLLFADDKKKQNEANRDLFDSNEIKMLEEERQKYVNYLVSKTEGFYPDILADESLFMKECKKSENKKLKIGKKKTDGENGKDGNGAKEGEADGEDIGLGLQSDGDEDDDDVRFEY